MVYNAGLSRLVVRVRIPLSPQNLKFVIMFKKNRYEDEERGLPEFVKAIIALAIVGGMLVFAWKIGEWSTEKDMEFQYQDQMVKVD